MQVRLNIREEAREQVDSYSLASEYKAISKPKKTINVEANLSRLASMLGVA
jgi:hypothetical protein